MNRKGFTLVEVLVSLVIVSVVLASMFAALVKIREKYNESYTKNNILFTKTLITRVLSKDINNAGGIKNASCVTDECHIYLANGERRLLEIITKTKELQTDSGTINITDYRSLVYSKEDDTGKKGDLIYIKTLKNDSDNSATKTAYLFDNISNSGYSYITGVYTTKMSFITIKIKNYKNNDNTGDIESIDDGSTQYDIILSSSSSYLSEKSASLGEPFDIFIGNTKICEVYGVGFTDCNGTDYESSMIPEPNKNYCINGTTIIKEGEIVVSNTYFKEPSSLVECTQ